MKDVLDPVHGTYIPITEEELPIFESPQVQRLRRVHQLGFTSKVYPGGTHTRFEHSIGVMHIAERLADSIGLDEEEVQAYKLGGLLHDIGHPPCSHSLEPLMREDMGIEHEEQTCRLIDEIDAEFPVDREWVKDIVLGRSEYDIVAGSVDADRMDYLKRDVHETGLLLGEIGIESIINFATNAGGQLAFDTKSVEGIERLLKARLQMNNAVYQHPTAKIAEKMLQRSVERFLEAEPVTMAEMAQWDDFQLHTYLLDSDDHAGLYNRLVNRDLYKRAIYANQEDIGREGLRRAATTITDEREIEREIAAEADIDPVKVVVDPPRLPGDGGYDVTIADDDEAMPLAAVSERPETLADEEWRNAVFGVYAPEEYADIVSNVAQRKIIDRV